MQRDGGAEHDHDLGRDPEPDDPVERHDRDQRQRRGDQGRHAVVAWSEPGRQLETWDAIKASVSDAIIDHGGTITHHHAVGRDHRPWYERERGKLFTTTLSGLKSTLDPEWVLNPGVLLEER